MLFHDKWQERCRQLLLVNFPKTKYWKAVNKSMYKLGLRVRSFPWSFLEAGVYSPYCFFSYAYNMHVHVKPYCQFATLISKTVYFHIIIGGDRHNFEPSSYCSEVIEGLLLPAMEAARAMAAETAQLSFLMLTVCVFLSELRRAITANKKMYG